MNTFLITLLIALLITPLVLLLDRFLGEPARFHAVVGFGRIANRLEAKLNKGMTL